MEPDEPGAAGALRLPEAARPRSEASEGAEAAVGALYQASALGLIRLAYVILGDQPSAEDVVQEAFCGLYRRWDRLAATGNATYYVRASVLNGCRSVLRHRAVRRRGVAYQLPEASAERLRALPARDVPAGTQVSGMALSPDGTLLAATIGASLDMESRLYVFDLATGTERTWSSKLCSRCLPGLIGFGFGGVNVGSLSWAADGRTLAFTWAGAGQGDVRLLDTAAPGTSLLADSKLAITTPNGPGPYWRAAVITPGGRTIVAVRELSGPRPGGRGVRVRQELVKFSVATGKVTAILNRLRIYDNYEQVLWTSSSGHALVVAGAGPGARAGILRGDHYTPIPWSPGILAAAW